MSNITNDYVGCIDQSFFYRNDIPEFTDELVNMSFSSFASDLEVRSMIPEDLAYGLNSCNSIARLACQNSVSLLWLSMIKGC